jgi:hypothetical protein
MGPTVSSGRETHGVETQKAIQRDPTSTVPLDGGRVTKNASDQPFLDLGKAFTAFFEGRACRPKFKSKKRSKPSFYLANHQFELGYIASFNRSR